VGLIPSKRSTKIRHGRTLSFPCRTEFHRPDSGQRGPHFYGEAERKSSEAVFSLRSQDLFFFSLMKEKEGSIGSTSLQQLRNEVAAPQLQETSVSSPPSCKFLHEVHVASIQATFDEPTTRTAKCHFKICRPRERRVRHGRGTNGENGNGRRQRPFPSFLC
jgi:hypothetical protein